jgi:hypothetical protein
VALTTGADIENEVLALKGRCDILEKTVKMLEKTVKDLQFTCNTHVNILDKWHKHIIDLQIHQGTFDLSYEGVEFKVTN